MNCSSSWSRKRIWRAAFSPLLAGSGLLALLSTNTAAADPRPPLSTSDVAILVPLKAHDAVDDIFKTQGTGLCNALPLGNAGVMTAEQFAGFAKTAFGRTEDGKCNGVSDGAIGGSDPEVLRREPTEHLARLRGLSGRVCRYGAWRIVGIRIDPCVGRAGKTLATRQDLAACTPQLRVIAQPWSTDGTPFPDDVAMHLLYSVPDLGALANDAFGFSAVTRTAVQGKPWDEADGDPNVLRPHPGLRLEMKSCDGPVSKAYRDLLAKHAKPTNLTNVAFMTSSTAQVQWTFGLTNATDPSWPMVANAAGHAFDNFSNDVFEFGDTFPFNESLKSAMIPQVATLYSAELLMSTGRLIGASASKAEGMAKTLERIDNPLEVGPAATTCISCHSTGQARIALANKGVTVPSRDVGFKVWPPFSENHRSAVNFRNFGYGPGFDMGVSTRALREADDVRRTLNTLFR